LPRTVGELRASGHRERGVKDEIRENLLAADTLPIDLMRAKLAMFGASKFDPKSNLWVRVTLFQGAPTLDELAPDMADDWIFPCVPDSNERGLGQA